MKPSMTLVRGNTIDLRGPVPINGAIRDLTGATFRSHLRALTPEKTKLQEFDCTLLNGPAGEVKLYATNLQSKAWNYTGIAYFDVEVTMPDETVVSTPLVYVDIIEGATHD